MVSTPPRMAPPSQALGQPLTLAKLDESLAAIGGFEAQPLIAVAVSGGPDSMALMLLADCWARMRGGRAWGLTVDHELRRDSADEARIVASWLAARAIPHEILRWEGEKPGSGIQEAAREARYRLLAGWCRKQGCLHLFTAHHLQDQIETHLIRRRAGSSIDGLAGMSAVRELDGCRLVRPLLAVCRERLQALLRAAGQSFLRDPSNLNPVFERARLRLTIADGSHSHAPEERERVRELLADIGRCARERIAREQALDRLIARAVWLHPAGFGVLDPAPLAAAASDIGARLLSRIVLCLGGLRYPARTARLARLLTSLLREPGHARTLGGCRFVPWRGRLMVLRELATAEKPIMLEPGAELRWDRRFVVSLPPEAVGGLMLGYFGQHGGARPQNGFGRMLPRLVHSVLPAFWDAEGVACIPHLGYVRPGSPVPPALSFRPARTLTSPSFTVV